MKFGLNQVWNQSPLIISRIKRALNFLLFSVGAFTPKLQEWFGWTPEGIITCISLIGLGINMVGIMFGIDPDGEPKKDNP